MQIYLGILTRKTPLTHYTTIAKYKIFYDGLQLWSVWIRESQVQMSGLPHTFLQVSHL